MSREKITISEIVELMTAKNNFSKKQTEEFVKMLLSTIEDVLIDGEVIKIKDFGTFKPQWNEPRKSVDVNTGEEIIVPGYYKVVFVPDNDFKEMVNQPFSHLLPIEQKQFSSSTNTVEKNSETDSDKDFDENKPLFDNVKTTMEPLRVFEEQAAQIKGLLSEIGALKSNTKKQTEQEIENIQNSEKSNDEIKIEETESENVVTDDVTESSAIENDETISTSEVNTEEEEETKTLKIYDNSMSRKQRKKLEKEEEKQRRREEIKRYFDENQFTVIREIQPSKDENAIISEEKIEQNHLTIQEKNVEESELENSLVENEEQISLETENVENEEVKIETPSEQEIEVINEVTESTNNESEIETEPVYDVEDQISEQNTETAEIEKSPEVIISDEITSENIIEEQTDENKFSATENVTITNNENQEKTQADETVTVEETNKFVENKNNVIDGSTIENVNTSSEIQTQDKEKLEITNTNPEEIDYKFTPIRKRRKRWFWLIFIPLLIAAIAFGIWWYFPQIKPYIQPYIEKIIPQTDKKETITPQKTVVETPTLKVDSTLLTQNDTVSANEVFTQEREYKEFIASEITTKEKDIKRIAKDRYGNEAFWIYIYEANNEEIEDPKKIEVGTPVKIPKLDPRLINVNNPECVRYAKKLADEYLN